jgi:hypothetical protein
MSQETAGVPREASWDDAPRLVEGATTLELTPQQCNLEYWIGGVAQGTLMGLVKGHAPDAEIPDYMREEGHPLREALVDEFAFRSISEEMATRAISFLVYTAPDVETMEFFGTQLIDEARHSRVFRDHIVELGVPEADLFSTIERYAGADRERILVPLQEFALPTYADDFAAGAVILTILVEGVLAPLAELSERKWRPLDPAAADIERGAAIDEIRHLTVGSAAVRQWVQAHPEDKEHLLDVITRGRELWAQLPVAEVIFRREQLYQQGLERHADVVGDYEIEDGLRLIDTTPEGRLEMALTWSNDMQEGRLAYMGLEEAIPS